MEKPLKQKDKIVIVLFKDGTLGIFAGLVKKSDFQEGSKFYEADENMPVYELCKWQLLQYTGIETIKEIKD